MAAVLACGPGSLLIGPSAGAHRRLIRNSGAFIDVATTRRVRQPGIRAHELALVDDDRSEWLGIPCASVARTLLDIAAIRPSELVGALEQAEVLEVFDLTAIKAVIARNEGQRGVRRLRRAVAAMAVVGPRFRSEFERRFLPITRAAGFPEPLINHVITLPDGPIEVDFYWPRLALVIEVDGYGYHQGRRAFRTDRQRDRRLKAAGISSIRYVWEDLDAPARIVAELSHIRELSIAGSHSRYLTSRGDRR